MGQDDNENNEKEQSGMQHRRGSEATHTHEGRPQLLLAEGVVVESHDVVIEHDAEEEKNVGDLVGRLLVKLV